MRSATKDEYEKTLKHFRESDNTDFCYGYPAVCNYQVHMIARIDDTLEFKKDNLQPHDDFDFALKSKLDWSKKMSTKKGIALGKFFLLPWTQTIAHT